MRAAIPALTLALALAGLGPAPVRAAAPGDPVVARRVTGPIAIDGRLEEPAWDDAVPYDGFVQLNPTQGAAPSERTEVLVLYDDHALYVAFHCFDARPREVARPLGRRDATPYSDTVTVFLDSNRDRRTAAYFQLNAAGVQEDGLLLADDQATTDWDAVWEGAVAATADGWTAELSIPLSALRFSSAPEQVWGIGLKRQIARTHEELVSLPLRKSDRGIVARLPDLTGLSGLEPVQQLSLAPYLASRLAWRPRYVVDDTRPRPRVVDPLGDVGLDLRTSLGRGLSLQATINPDFGQVEADQIVENLTTFELFLPEKRPFFTQGMDLFQGVAPNDHRSPQQLFYSRRIGLDAPILGAGKLTGRASDEWQVAVLEAVVAGGTAPGAPDAAARGLRFQPSQPLHFGPADALPIIPPASRNFVAAFARYQPSAVATFGLTATSAEPLGPRCTTAETFMDDTVRPARCDVDVGQAVAADWSLRTPDGAWYLRGQVTGSRFEGGPPSRALLDGTLLQRGDLGQGGFVAFGRQGGEPWRLDATYEYESPRLDVNAVGYQRTQNEQLARAVLRYVRPSGGGPFRSYGLHLGAEARFTTDGLGRQRGNAAFLDTELQLQSFDSFGVNLNASFDYDDVRELEQSGVALRRPGTLGVEAWLSSDKGRAVWLEGGVGVGHTLARGRLPSTRFWGAGATLSVRPHPRAETRLDLGYDDSAWPLRYVTDDAPAYPLAAPATFTLAALHAPSISVTLRQSLVLTPRLTFQAYAQLFAAAGRYGAAFTATAPPRGLVGYADLAPLPGGAPPGNDFRESALNLSAVLRWEYRLGASLYVVYTRSAVEVPWPDGVNPPFTLRPQGLGHGPTRDTFLVKWSWYWGA